MNPQELGKFISKIRAEEKLTQEQLSEKLHVSNKTISKWERGISQPDFQTLISISNALNISLDEIAKCKRKETSVNKDANNLTKIQKFKKCSTPRNIIIAILGLIFLFLSIFSIIYVCKDYDTEKLYRLVSLNDDYEIDGIYYKSNHYCLLLIKYIGYLKNGKDVDLNYEYEILVDSNRISYVNSEETKKVLNISKTVKNINFIKSNKNDYHISKINTENLSIKLFYIKSKGNVTTDTIPLQLVEQQFANMST